MQTRLVTAVFALLSSGFAAAQSEGPSAVSAISVAPSVVAAQVSLAGMHGSATLVVSAVHASGDMVELVLEGAALGASVTLEIASELAAELSLAVGDVVVCSVTAGGWLLREGGEAIAFVPNAAARALIHRREITH